MMLFFVRVGNIPQKQDAIFTRLLTNKLVLPAGVNFNSVSLYYDRNVIFFGRGGLGNQRPKKIKVMHKVKQQKK